MGTTAWHRLLHVLSKGLMWPLAIVAPCKAAQLLEPCSLQEAERVLVKVGKYLLPCGCSLSANVYTCVLESLIQFAKLKDRCVHCVSVSAASGWAAAASESVVICPTQDRLATNRGTPHHMTLF